ncbi:MULTISPECIES: hypothetical protein [unclassified Streptococcus]|uniref:hypothetical protein n=1 Tax=unclassified Streptococcus TaxID=2608887 RepID=UPI0010728B94|nr:MULTISPECIES: hypothetical protein [unclassified Streptococcus]MBF0786767.1 hypothetical protein [Streptococcus sp. 19428wC2_LYSM12]MCQ9211004.1 hypothetical protein [Streptococcus sp. B01]MCQ9214277.1 hypothetical protein [Streptococcus sp. O1]TFV06309.1 hypothetical protein E4T79_02385 [Streptococcus sp. LYSM12]
MKNQQLDPLTMMVEANKKKRKRILKVIFGIVGSLFFVAAVAGFIFYRNGIIEGKWENPSFATEMKQIAVHEFSGDLEETFPLNPEEVVGETGVTLEVKDNKAVVTLYSTFNKKALLTAYDKGIQKEYEKVLAEAEQKATEYGVDKETLLKETFGDDYEAKIKANFPKPEGFEKQFDDMLARELAENSKARYDAASGRFSAVYFEGEINPLTHSLQITAVNPAPDFASLPLIPKKGDTMFYTHNGNTLTFIGGEEYPFKAAD